MVFLEGFEGLWIGHFGYILLPFGVFSVYLVFFVVIGYIFSCFGMLYREKSGNPAGFNPISVSIWRQYYLL
jgi:hypothetical protein